MPTNNVVISIVDDDESLRKATQRLLKSAGLNVETFGSAEEFLVNDRAGDSACLILDLPLPGISGLDLQSRLAAAGSHIPIIFISGHGDGQARTRALELGAIDFLQKPFSEQSLFKAIDPFIGRSLSSEEFDAGENLAKKQSPPTPTNSVAVDRRHKIAPKLTFDQIVGQSPGMHEMLRLALKVAQSQVSSVLLQGQSGTGKDLVAKAIHYASNRAERPFVAINCAALPPNLIESELFGHEKGAFTDAKAMKEGLLDQGGGGGTIFLDEISEMDLSLQAKLLRVLEEGSFRRVGGLKDVPFNARVIASSNRDLKREGEAGRFRLDLYYRLAVIQLDMPPLCERGDDVLLLAKHFIAHFGKAKIKGLTQEVARAFRSYQWPGNVREMRNVIERAMVLEEGDMISIRSLPREIVPDETPEAPHRVSMSVIDADATISLPAAGISLNEVETSLLRQALAQASGNQTRAAELLGLTRDQFRYRLKKLRQTTVGS